MPSIAIPVLSFTDFQDGMRSQEKENKASRLANRESFMKISKEMSDQGQTMSVEDWAAASKDILGPAAWLSVNNPSQQAMELMQSQQTAAAERTAEVRRREQFKADTEEKNTILADVHDQFLSGKTPAETQQYAMGRYGPDLLGRLNLNFDQEHQKAIFEAQAEGRKQGALMYQTVDEAKSALDKQDWMPQVKKDALIAGAQANQSATEALVTKEAISRGGLGWIGNEADQVGLRSAIRTLVPTASKEYEEKLLQQAMQTAKAAAQNAVTAKHTENQIAIQTDLSKNGITQMEKWLALDQSEQQERQKMAATLMQQFSSAEASQAAMAAGMEDKAKVPKGADPAVYSRAAGGLRSYIFDNPMEYVDAVLTKNSAKEKELIANAKPISERRAVVSALANIVTGKFSSVEELAGVVKQSKLFGSKESIAAVGKAIKENDDIANKVVETPGKRPYSGWSSGMIEGDPFGLVDSNLAPSGSEIRQTAQQSADSMRRGFITKAADEIKGFRDAVRSNTHVGATAEQMKAIEEGMARDKARALLKGMGVVNPIMETEFVLKIMEAAGDSQALTRTPYYSEQYKEGVKNIRQSYLLTPGTATLPGAAVPSPREGAGSVYTPPPDGSGAAVGRDAPFR